MGVAWVWSTLSELFAYPNGSGFPLGQRGSDNRGWTVVGFRLIVEGRYTPQASSAYYMYVVTALVHYNNIHVLASNSPAWHALTIAHFLYFLLLLRSAMVDNNERKVC